MYAYLIAVLKWWRSCTSVVYLQLHVRPDEHVAIQHGAHAASALIAGALTTAVGDGGGGDARVDVGAVRRLRCALRVEPPLARAAARLRLSVSHCVCDCLSSSSSAAAAARALSVAPAARTRIHRRGLCAQSHCARASGPQAIAEYTFLTLLALGIDVYGTSVNLILIARRSCLQAGARFHKRGVNSQVILFILHRVYPM